MQYVCTISVHVQGTCFYKSLSSSDEGSVLGGSSIVFRFRFLVVALLCLLSSLPFFFCSVERISTEQFFLELVLLVFSLDCQDYVHCQLIWA